MIRTLPHRRIGHAALAGAARPRGRPSPALVTLALGVAGVLWPGALSAQPADAARGAGEAARSPSSCPEPLWIAIERPFAARNGLGPGDRLDVSPEPGGLPCAAVVRAVFEPPPDPARLTLERPRVRFSFPDLARLAARPDAADWLTIALARGTDPEAVAERLRPSLPGLRVLRTAEVTERASTTFLVIRRFHGAIAWITLVAGGVFLTCIMFLKVGERREAVSALRLVGISRRTLARWILLEAALVALLGGALGLGVGAVASALVNRFYRAAYDTTLVFSLITPGILIQSLALALGMGIGAGALATYRLLATDPLGEIGR